MTPLSDSTAKKGANPTPTHPVTWVRTCALGLVLVFVSQVETLVAEEIPSPETSSVSTPPSEVDKSNPVQSSQSVFASVDAIQRSIEEIEINLGVYDESLVAPLNALSRAHLNQGDYQAGIQAMRRALYLQRVNFGPFDISQAPMLEALNDAYIAQNNIEATQDTSYYLLRLYGQNYSYLDARLIPVINRIVGNHLMIAKRGSVSEQIRGRSLIDAFELSNQNLIIANRDARVGDDEIKDMLYQHAQINFMVGQYKQDNQLEDEYYNRAFMQTFSTRDLRTPLNPVEERLDRVNHYATGKKSLEAHKRIIEEQENAGLLEKVEAQALIGDWFALFGKRDAARKAYREAYQLTDTVTESDDEASAEDTEAEEQQPQQKEPAANKELIANFFVQPQPIKFRDPVAWHIEREGGVMGHELLGPLPSPDNQSVTATGGEMSISFKKSKAPNLDKIPLSELADLFLPGSISAKFDISPTGYVKRMQLLESHPESLRGRSLREALEEVRFRPVFQNGKMVATDGHVQTFEFLLPKMAFEARPKANDSEVKEGDEPTDQNVSNVQTEQVADASVESAENVSEGSE